jgi:hypothetical protein
MRDLQHEYAANPEATVNTHLRPRGWHLNTVPADDTVGDGSLYVITFCTAGRQMALRVRFDHELEGLSVFRSRTVEHGRERFRMHLAYFEFAAQAQQTLAIVRRYYPNAWISATVRNNLMRESCLDISNLASIDDTMSTAFSTTRRPTARGATSRVVALPPSAAATATPAEQLRLIDSAPVAGPQRYVVQLEWLTTPVSLTTVPRLAVFHAHNLYRIRTLHEGRPQHAIRLGFFTNVDGARQVAEHVRDYYPRGSVAPVSDGEFARVVELTRQRTRDARATVESRSASAPPLPRARASTAPALSWASFGALCSSPTTMTAPFDATGACGT